jgi:hypothetical protein
VRLRAFGDRQRFAQRRDGLIRLAERLHIEADFGEGAHAVDVGAVAGGQRVQCSLLIFQRRARVARSAMEDAHHVERAAGGEKRRDQRFGVGGVIR